MRYVILLALGAHAICYGQETQTTKTAKIEEIFRLTKTDQLQKQMMTQMSALMKQQTMAGLTAEERQRATDAGQRVIEFTMKKMSWEAMKPEFVKLYDETYTEDEISGILLFYQSAPGQAMLAKSPVLMANTMALVQKRMAEIKPELDEMIKKNLAK
jgi:uncharacterized protein